jgi:predicted secreted protein
VRGKIGVLGTIGAAALLALGVAGCGGSSGSPDNAAAASPSPTAAASVTTVTDTELPEVVHARVGDTINVMLHSNASTGYHWVAQDLNDAAVLKQDGDGKVIAPKSTMVGAPGHTQFTFTVMKEGTDEIGFWYQPPGSGPSGATWALVVQASAGHLPVSVDAGEDYTAETAQLRTGDNLLVSIDDAANAGRHAWKMVGGSPLVKPVSQKFTNGTQQLTFAGVSAGTGTLVLVNQPTGDPPLQTYAVPLAVKAPAAPVTIQLNKKSADPANQNVLVKSGDTIQVSLEDQPSADFQWKFQKPNARVLKQVGQPKFFANNGLMGSKGKMVWTFSVVGPGKTPLIADY